MEEVIVKVEGYEDYEISSYGYVISSKYEKKKVLTPVKNVNGYLYVGLLKNGVQKNMPVSKLVIDTFLKPKEDKYKIIALDGDKGNSKLENLTYCSKNETIETPVLVSIRHNINPYEDNVEGEVINMRKRTFKPIMSITKMNGLFNFKDY